VVTVTNQPNAVIAAFETFLILGSLLFGAVTFFIILVRKTANMDADHCCMCGARELYYKNKRGSFYCMPCVQKYSLAWEDGFYKLAVPVLVKARKVKSRATFSDEHPTLATLGKHSRLRRVLMIYGNGRR
jgi:hypothetical protein